MQQVFPRENRNVYSWIYLGGKNRPFQCVEYVHELPFVSTYLYAYRNPSDSPGFMHKDDKLSVDKFMG